MNLASFFSTIGFKIDDAALIELKKKVGEVNNAIKGSAKQAAKASTKVTQSFNSHVDAWKAHQKQLAAVETAHQKAFIEDIQRNRKKQELIRKEAQKTLTHERRLELQKQTHQNRLERDRLREAARTRAGRQRGFSTMASGATGLARSALAGYGVFELGRGVFAAAQVRAKTLAALSATGGGKENAAKDYKFLNKEVDRLALNLEAASEGFIMLKGSALGSKMAAEDVNKIFSGTSELMTVYGASGDDLKGAFRALGQMMSKTKITSEELKGQLSERMYGAVALTAKAAGMEVPQLLKMMEKGSADAIKLLPKMAEEFHKAAIEGNALGQALESPQAKLNRLQTQWQRFLLKFADSGALDVILGIFTDLSNTLTKLSQDGTLTSLANSFKIVFSALGTLLKYAADFIVWIDKTIGLENALYIFFGVKLLGWISALRGAVSGLAADFVLLAEKAIMAGAGASSVLKGGAMGLAGRAGAIGAAGVGGWMLGSAIYDKYAVQIQDFLANDDPRITNLTKAVPVPSYRLPGPTKAQGAVAGVGVLKIQLDDNLQLQAKMEGIANDQINVQIMKTEAAMPGSR